MDRETHMISRSPWLLTHQRMSISRERATLITSQSSMCRGPRLLPLHRRRPAQRQVLHQRRRFHQRHPVPCRAGNRGRTCQVPVSAWLASISPPMGSFMRWAGEHGWLGNDFAHPFEYNPGSNSWAIKSASFPDNQVSDMACGVLTDSGTPYIYCVGGSAGGQTTATARVFRYNPVTDMIDTVAAPWPGDTDGITLPGGFSVFNNKLYIVGGFRINTAMSNQIWEFTPTSNLWVQKSAVCLSRAVLYQP